MPIFQKVVPVVNGDQISDSNPMPISGSLAIDTAALATGAKQDTGNASLSSMVTNQQSGLSILDQIIRILFNIARPGWWDVALNRLRQTAIIESGTVTTVTTVAGVTTVTTVTGLTNLDGYQAKLPVINNNMAAWSLTVGARFS